MGVKDNIQDYIFFLSVDIKKHLQNGFKLSSLLICVKHIWEMFQFLLFGAKEEAWKRRGKWIYCCCIKTGEGGCVALSYERILVWIAFMNSCWNWAVICKCYSRENVEWRPLAVLSVEQITLGLFWGHPISHQSIFPVPCNVSFLSKRYRSYCWQYFLLQHSPSCWKLDNRIKTGGVPPPCKSKKRPL